MTAVGGDVGKARRQRRLAALIRAAPAASQEQLAERLAAEGLRATQATISRDLAELGAVKARRGGAAAYALPEPEGQDAAARLAQVFEAWVEKFEPAGGLIVLHTPPGGAHLVGAALDAAQRPDIAGCVAGDDTVMVAVRDGFAATTTLAWLRALAAG